MDQAQLLHIGPTDADEAREVWNACLELIRDKVNTQSFKTWFEPVLPLYLRAGKLTVQVPSQFFYDWLEEHYNSVISSTITNVLGKEAQLEYALGPEEPIAESDFGVSLPAPRTEFKEFPPQPDTFTTTQQPGPAVSIGAYAPSYQSSLNPRYTFDKFIKGDSNQLARAAALAVANNPGGTSFNPLVIYGGVGLGKTHLIHSIGNYAIANGKAQRAIYVSSDRFTQEFIDAVARDRLNDFSNFYRSMDILIVDDIQFFSGKEKTQDSFFHTFNVLHQLGKQLVLSSDRPPKELKGLQDRLISRFQWGLTSDIQPPDLEMRIAILRKKSADDGIELPEEVVEFIAANVTSNIRQMEGCLINLLAAASLSNREITIDLAREAVKVVVGDVRSPITVESIQKTVCEYFSIADDLMRAKTRKQEIVTARQIAMYLAKELTNSSLKTIGLHFGGRDHSTVIHAYQSVEDQMRVDPKFEANVSQIRKRLQLLS